jgi:hypothetical protein
VGFRDGGVGEFAVSAVQNVAPDIHTIEGPMVHIQGDQAE